MSDDIEKPKAKAKVHWKERKAEERKKEVIKNLRARAKLREYMMEYRAKVRELRKLAITMRNFAEKDGIKPQHRKVCRWIKNSVDNLSDLYREDIQDICDNFQDGDKSLEDLVR